MLCSCGGAFSTKNKLSASTSWRTPSTNNAPDTSTEYGTSTSMLLLGNSRTTELALKNVANLTSPQRAALGPCWLHWRTTRSSEYSKDCALGKLLSLTSLSVASAFQFKRAGDEEDTPSVEGHLSC